VLRRFTFRALTSVFSRESFIPNPGNWADEKTYTVGRLLKLRSLFTAVDKD